MTEKLQELIGQGANVPCPEQVCIGTEVDLTRISRDVTIHAGCRIGGSRTSIGPGSVLGAEGPLTLENCQLGPGVKLKGGFCSGSVFLAESNVGSAAHIRPGCLLEEEAGGGHAVGLKQTILLPFVTAGSLINFCDCLMSGGTSRKNHSEVGSSFVHFNFTPQGDKATASLIGDVPRGIFLDQAPIFLGGQGGLVGPRRINYGTVLAAGSVLRKDVADEGRLIRPASPRQEINVAYDVRIYRDVLHRLNNNLHYIGNLIALRAWYLTFRKLIATDPFEAYCVAGAIELLNGALVERTKRVEQFRDKVEKSLSLAEARGSGLSDSCRQEHEELLKHWESLPRALDGLLHGDQTTRAPAGLKPFAERVAGDDYVRCMQHIDENLKKETQKWLQGLVDQTVTLWQRTSV